MKGNILLIAIFGLLVAFAASRVYAAAVTNDQDMTVSGSVPNPCTGNIDTFSDTVHMHSTFTLSPSGTVHTDTLLHASDLKLVDPSVGQCSGQASLFLSADTTLSALPLTTTGHLTAQLECPGAANNFSANAQAHITTNPDGTTTVSFDNFDIECQ